MLDLVDMVDDHGLGIADADFIVEAFVCRAVDVLLDGAADDGAETCMVVVCEVGPPAGKADSEGSPGDYHASTLDRKGLR